MFPSTSTREILRLSGKQNKLFPEGADINCIVYSLIIGCLRYVYYWRVALYTHSLEFILGLLVNFVQSYVMFEVSVCLKSCIKLLYTICLKCIKLLYANGLCVDEVSN